MDRTNRFHAPKISRLVPLTAVILFVFGMATVLHAQNNTGRISAVVKDESGAAVNSADVMLMTSQQSVLRDARTDGEGRFKWEGIPSGSYLLVISRNDFNTQRQVVRVNAGETTNIDVLLQVNQISEQVTVTAEAGLVADARSVAQPVNVINEKEILERATEVVAQAVDEEPGVNLQRTSPSLSAVFVRGLTGRNVGVYVDGVRYTTSAQRGGVGHVLQLDRTFRAWKRSRSCAGPTVRSTAQTCSAASSTSFRTRRVYGASDSEWHGHTNVFYSSVTNSFGGNQLLTYGTRRFGLLLNANGSAGSIACVPATALDSHSALTRFLGIPSNLFGSRLPDTASLSTAAWCARISISTINDPTPVSAMREISRTAASVTINCSAATGT